MKLISKMEMGRIAQEVCETFVKVLTNLVSGKSVYVTIWEIAKVYIDTCHILSQ
jgi:hypothetical protein